MKHLKNDYEVREKVKLLVDFYVEKGREPKQIDMYKGEQVGSFLNRIRSNGVKLSIEERKILEDLGIRLTAAKTNIRRYDKSRVELLAEFYIEKEREPKQSEIYKGKQIGCFLNRIRSGTVNISLEDRKRLEDLGIRLIPVKRNTKRKVYLLKEFYVKNGREPKQFEIYEGERIGGFLNRIRNGMVNISAEDRKMLENVGLRLNSIK